MAISNLLVLFMVLWVPVDTQSATEKSVLWISCKECRKSFTNTNGTFNWRCKYGCDRYYTNAPNGPVSITKPTIGTGTRKGSFLDCRKCFGHGLNPSADPRCRFGCGRFMTYPPRVTKKVKNIKIDNLDERNMENVAEMNGHDGGTSGEIPFNLKTSEDGKIKTNSHKKASLRYKHLILLIGLYAGVTATIIGYLFYRRKRTPKASTITFASENVAIEMRDA